MNINILGIEKGRERESIREIKMGVPVLIEKIRSDGNDAITHEVTILGRAFTGVGIKFIGSLRFFRSFDDIITIKLRESELQDGVKVEFGRDGEVGKKIKEPRDITINPGFFLELAKEYKDRGVEAVAVITWFSSVEEIPEAPTVSYV